MVNRTMRWLVVVAASLAAGSALAQDHGGGGGGGCGDVFGDLVQIRRDALTGQPILERAWVLLPGDVYGWAYCPVPVDTAGTEIPFLADTCDVDPAEAARVVPVDYFGRLGAGRTKERNLRMHFDEVIEKIKMSQAVSRDGAGRIALGSGCTVSEDGEPVFESCTSWDVVDSPLENLALYHRAIKYGHFQTDPAEIDVWAHGDPVTLPQYHVALEAADWAKFDEPLRKLLPVAPGNAAAAASCFADIAACVAPQVLQVQDFPLAASFLGAAADKHGRITLELVSYMNRILRVTCGDTPELKSWCEKPTESAANPANALPALVRNCFDRDGLPKPCTIAPADVPIETKDENGNYVWVVPADSGFPANETFVNFGAIQRPGLSTVAPARYDRVEWFASWVPVIRPEPGTLGSVWRVDQVWLPAFLALKNPLGAEGRNAPAFVNASSDAVRAVQFIHEYAVPGDLGFFPY